MRCRVDYRRHWLSCGLSGLGFWLQAGFRMASFEGSRISIFRLKLKDCLPESRSLIFGVTSHRLPSEITLEVSLGSLQSLAGQWGMQENLASVTVGERGRKLDQARQ